MHRCMVVIATGVMGLLLCTVLLANVPNRINYQGKLTTDAGGCVNDTVQMIFSIYPDTLGSPAIWTETQSQVSVREGVFSVLLGEADFIPAFVFDGSTRYLGIRVESDPEMRPLKPMVSVGYAFHSTTADTAFNITSNGLTGIDSVFNPGGNVDLIPGNAITVTPDDSGNSITIGETHSERTDNPHKVTASQTGALVSVEGINHPGGDIDLVEGANMTITRDTSAKTITFTAASSGGWIDDGGIVRLETNTDSVGIGTSSPEAMLHVRSNNGTGSIKVESSTGVKGGFKSLSTFSQIGTETNHDFQIASNGIDRIWVKSDGKIGIGTSSPSQTLDVSGTVQTAGFKMPTDASSGKVLTSDASGIGTWQTPSGGVGGSGTTNYIPKFAASSTLGNSVIYQNGSSIGIGLTNPPYKLTVGGSFYASTVNTGWGDYELYAMDQNVRTTDNPTFNQLNLSDYGTALGGLHIGGTSDPGTGNLVVDSSVGIGTASPGGKLHVASSMDYSGYFTSSKLSSSTRVVYSEFIGSGSFDVISVYGKSIPADYYGIGGYFEGGYVGAEGRIAATGSHDYRGVAGYATGGSGTNYGVYGSASGGAANFGVYYSGGLAGTGTKSCVVKTSRGPTLLYCQESPENWFEDFGEAQLKNGRVHIWLDSLFLETVTIDAANPIKIFVQLEGDCNGVYVSKGVNSFDVIELHNGTSNVPFSYRVVAKRKGFENLRLDYTKSGENDPYLYPEANVKDKKIQTENTKTTR